MVSRAKHHVTLTLPWPPSVNECKRPCVVKGKARLVNTKVLSDYYKTAAAVVLEQGKGGRQLSGRLRLVLVLSAPDKRWYDVSNRIKATEDALVKSGIISDDSKVDSLVIERGEPFKGGRVVVTVEELPRAFEAVGLKGASDERRT